MQTGWANFYVPFDGQEENWIDHLDSELGLAARVFSPTPWCRPSQAENCDSAVVSRAHSLPPLFFLFYFFSKEKRWPQSATPKALSQMFMQCCGNASARTTVQHPEPTQATLIHPGVILLQSVLTV